VTGLMAGFIESKLCEQLLRPKPQKGQASLQCVSNSITVVEYGLGASPAFVMVLCTVQYIMEEVMITGA